MFTLSYCSFIFSLSLLYLPPCFSLASASSVSFSLPRASVHRSRGQPSAQSQPVSYPTSTDILQDPVTTACGLQCPSDASLRCVPPRGKHPTILLGVLGQRLCGEEDMGPTWLLVNLQDTVRALEPLDMQPERERLCEHNAELLSAVS